MKSSSNTPTRPRTDAVWPRCGASAVIFRGPEVLLVERGRGAFKGLWSLPGGHIEAGEAARTAALREVHEETGVGAEIDELLDMHEVLVRSDEGAIAAHYVIAVFLGRWTEGEPRPGGDAAKARFAALTELGRYPLTDGAKDLITRAWNRLGDNRHGINPDT